LLTLSSIIVPISNGYSVKVILSASNISLLILFLGLIASILQIVWLLPFIFIYSLIIAFSRSPLGYNNFTSALLYLKDGQIISGLLYACIIVFPILTLIGMILFVNGKIKRKKH